MLCKYFSVNNKTILESKSPPYLLWSMMNFISKTIKIGRNLRKSRLLFVVYFYYFYTFYPLCVFSIFWAFLFFQKEKKKKQEIEFKASLPFSKYLYITFTDIVWYAELQILPKFQIYFLFDFIILKLSKLGTNFLS